MKKLFYLFVFSGIFCFLFFGVNNIVLADQARASFSSRICDKVFEGRSANDWCTGGGVGTSRRCDASQSYYFCKEGILYHFSCRSHWFFCNCDENSAWQEKCAYGCSANGKDCEPPPARPVPGSGSVSGGSGSVSGGGSSSGGGGSISRGKGGSRGLGSGDSNFVNPIKWKTFAGLINAIINFIFNIALVVSPIMFIIGGFYFITAAGDPSKIKTAKDVILYTAIGLLVVLLAKGLIQVLEQVMGVKIGG